MQVEPYQTNLNPVILDSLPDIPISDKGCPRRARLQIDLMLLAIEALALGSSERMLVKISELELQGIIPNRVVLWRLRSTNPLRRYSQRQPLTLKEAKALVVIIAMISRELTVRIRQLLIDFEQMQRKQIPIEQHLQLYSYLERFQAHFRSRMNPRRAGVIAYNSPEKLNDLAIALLGKLLFCTGTAGMQRFWMSLFDGEIA
ncbi:MAG: DUF3038 domain-containing protein [Limnospira sp. PMC 1291.21]|nr:MULTISPECIES: DUF3038 domain-containing protein [Limnospira]EKD11331.1 hypothetical protein SPLC1_S031610 [Arthrospira platensis C1]MDC0837409.1 DUF3038 domain-containing protein [Limnoraphis robusta]MDT9309942.1 DUF3038 domain-containing protein [Limnospira sp. Paracas R14]MDY7053905.1 DUF3038 domain-containing protein [Limnospira fusiformis LS22]QJB29620.1 DUF3038 domain-containing protein [Limnospira fusiformis SAG 85.79]